MRRRDVVTLAAGAATWPFARPLAAEAQRRVGALSNIDVRVYGGDPSLLAAYVEELVSLRPDVIFAFTGPVARAVQQRTSVVPIVFVGGGDPSSAGIVRSIA
jgi:ABC-type uncharacterized transport system substrate-binding protein